MTEIEVTYNIIFTAKSPFNEATYGELELDEAIENEQNVGFEEILEMLHEGNYDKNSVKFVVDVETLDS